MKFIFLVIGAIFVGALAVFAIPSSVFQSGSDSIHSLTAQTGLKQFTLADLNPLRFIFDYEKQQINTPMTPEQLGFHGSAVELKPFQMPQTPSFHIDQDAMNRAFAAQAESQIEQSYQRSQALEAYGRDPTHWVGPPPQ